MVIMFMMTLMVMTVMVATRAISFRRSFDLGISRLKVAEQLLKTAQGTSCRVSRQRVSGSGLRLQGLGFRVSDSGIWAARTCQLLNSFAASLGALRLFNTPSPEAPQPSSPKPETLNPKPLLHRPWTLSLETWKVFVRTHQTLNP